MTKIFIFLLFYMILYSAVVNSREINGFDLAGSTIPPGEILQGGPPRDGIPALDTPFFMAADKAQELFDNDIVLGISFQGQARAYPIRIMNWHEVVNDKIADQPIVVTYCPLCGSGVIFNALVDGRRLRFGVSGLLYNSDVLLYDKETESLWSQLKDEAVSGRFRGKKLQSLPMEQTSWKDWQTRYPETQVLSFNTGFRREYQRNPYSGYEATDQLFFPVKFRAMGLHPKEQVIGIALNGEAKAWPFVELNKTEGKIRDSVGGVQVKVIYDRSNQSAKIVDEKENLLPGITLFWFAWSGFHPDTMVYRFE